MNSNYFIQQLAFDVGETTLPTDVTTLAHSIGVDFVYCSGNYPTVFFKEVTDFGELNLRHIAEIQRKIWNNSSVVLLYVVSEAEIRIYNCNSTPVFFNTEITNLDTELQKRQLESCYLNDIQQLDRIKSVFSAIAIDSGRLWTSEYSNKIKLKTKVDRYLVESLLRLARKLNADLDDNTIHSLLIRSIFLMYLQDRKAIPDEIWEKIGAKDFLQILDNKEKTYCFFEEIADHFHGNILPVDHNECRKVTEEHLKLLKMCLIDGDTDLIQRKLFDWRLFDFSFIRIELLSEIYENFLNVFDPIRKKRTGTYYTPSAVVELVLDNVLPKEYETSKFRIMDFACGSGIFLAQAYKRIVGYWKSRNGAKKLDFNTLSKLMTDNIFGAELDPKSIKVAAFSLYLALLDFLEPRDIWFKNGEEFPLLINNPKYKSSTKNGQNLFCTDSIEDNNLFERFNYDIIVGNPPFGTNNLPKNIRDYCEKYSFDKQYAIPFIHKSVRLAPNGKIALLFNTKLLTNKKNTARNFRRWLFNDNYVEKIYNLSILRKAPENFGGQLFASATVPVSIICFRKSVPKSPSPSITYFAPRSFIKSHIAEGVIIDNTDIKYIPREICHEPDINIWKIAQWGTIGDYFLIKKLANLPQIGSSFNESDNGVGFQTLDKTTQRPVKNDQIKKYPYVQPEQICRYSIQKSALSPINACIKTQETKVQYLKYYKSKDINLIPPINVFRRIGKINSFRGPHILVKEGLLDKKVCASYLDTDCSFNSKVFGIHHKDALFLKALTCYINSKFSTYFLFLTSASWGIEREEIKPDDIKSLPRISATHYKPLNKLLNDITKKQSNILSDDIGQIENQIDSIIYESLNLSDKEVVLIEDLYRYSLSLFSEGEKSPALFPISLESPETIEYVNIVCRGLNEISNYDNYIVNGKIFKVLPNNPLNVCVLKFEREKKNLEIVESDSELSMILKEINDFTIRKYSQNIYVRKQVRYYDNDSIYLIKPNQKRFWTKSQGIEDAESILTEISHHSNDW